MVYYKLRKHFMKHVENDLYRVVAFQRICGLTFSESQLDENGGGCCGEKGHCLSHNDNNDGDCIQKKKQIDLTIRNNILHWLMILGAALGNEAMFASFLPFLYWNISWQMARHIIVVWFFSEYVGQVVKDMFCLPRPLSPPVIQLEQHYATEYGLPSTHAMAAVGMSNYVFLYTTNHIQNFPVLPGFLVVIFWCFLTCMSRLYLGVHSVIDVYTGLGLGFLCLTFEIFLCSYVDYYVLLHDNYCIPLGIVATFIFMLAVYPRNRSTWSSSFGDTTRVLAVACGCFLADWLHTDLIATSSSPFQARPPTVFLPEFHLANINIWIILLRCIVGYGLMFIMKAISKKLMYTIMPFIVEGLGLAKGHIPNVQNCNRYIIEVPSVFVTYCTIGFTAVFTAPTVMNYLGIPI